MFKIITNAIIVLSIMIIGGMYLSLLCIVLFLNSFANPSKYLKSKIISLSKRFLFHLMISSLSYWFPHPIYVRYNSNVLRNKRTIVMSNHCSDYDWLFLLVLLHDMDMYESHKIILKRSVANIPLIGYILRRFGYIFLNRSKDKDLKIIKKGIEKMVKEDEFSVVIYPEGTYLSTEALEKSKSYAEKTDLKVNDEKYVPDRVLLPRKTGFNHLRSLLRGKYDGVIDVTILMNPYIYLPCEECSCFDIFLAKSQVISQFILVDFVKDDEITEEFLIERFKKKEDKIQEYLKCTDGVVKTEREFLETLEKIEGKPENVEIKSLHIYSRFGFLLFNVPLSLSIFLIFRMLSY